jgi:6-hydroxycyclohex-1-ene-1-carbonyl-CoA dehydrogenase
VPEDLPEGLSLAHLSVIADAVTTPFEAIRRSGLAAGEVSIFVGAGGVGGFGVQIAAALGSRVVAIDVEADRLKLAERYGAELTLDANSLEWRELRSAVRSFAKQAAPDGIGPKVFETSGTTAGQATAFGLLGPGSYLGVVGYTPHKIELRQLWTWCSPGAWL